MERNKVEDRLREIEKRVDSRQQYSGTLDQDETDMVWMLIILRTLLDGRKIL